MKTIIPERIMIAGVLGVSFAMIASLAEAQTPQCYMITPSGARVNLESICDQPSQPIVSNNNNAENSVAATQINQSAQVQTQPTTTLPNPTQRTVFNIPENNFNTLSGQQIIGVQNNLRNIATDGVGSQLQLITTSTTVRTEPSGGTLVGQLTEGEWVQIYPTIRANGSVYVETRNGNSGWIDLGNISGFSPRRY